MDREPAHEALYSGFAQHHFALPAVRALWVPSLGCGIGGTPPDAELRATADRIRRWLRPGGVSYGLDPSPYRLSVGRYQTPDERELKPSTVFALFDEAGFMARAGYRAARLADEAIVRMRLLRALGSDFERSTRRPSL